MGNWRTVYLLGECSEYDLPALRKAVHVGEDMKGWHCLGFWRSSLCGLNDWPGETIHRVGNLFERDYTIEDVAKQLEELVKVAPSLNLKVHCGGDWEDKTCQKTITVSGGRVFVEDPEIETLPEISDVQMMDGFYKALLGSRMRRGKGG